MGSGLVDARSGLPVTPHSTDDPALAAAQAARLEDLLAGYDGCPEESWMILCRIEIACLQAGDRDGAETARRRAAAMAKRSGYAATERWERSPRWFKFLTRRFRNDVEDRWTEGLYARASRVIDEALSDLGHRPVPSLA